MGIIAWIALGLAAGLLAIMLLPGQKPTGPNFRLPDLLHRGAGRRWVASLPGARDLVSFSAWLAAIAEAAVLLLACYLLTGPPRRPGGSTAR